MVENLVAIATLSATMRNMHVLLICFLQHAHNYSYVIILCICTDIIVAMFVLLAKLEVHEDQLDHHP